ncbi:MAG TPA: DUF1641 domain-containing protein [Candidatus Binatia bacterium]|jgi:uncharacterized protein YjgD (DUF1641 family)|nr:DUF1641 domain-containing protein [Candidatus Binatia bacterium]
MAHPIAFEPPPRDPRAHFAARLHSAPTDHAEALVSAMQVVQLLHDRGVLDLLRGALGSGDALVTAAVGAASAPESVRALRNLMVLINTLATIDPSLLADVTRAVPEALCQARIEEARPPGLWKLLGTFFDRDFRRGLAAANDIFVGIGRNLSARART